jgi:hypothetical protein
MARKHFDPTYTDEGRQPMPEDEVRIMRQIITILERSFGYTRTEIANISGVDKMLVSRLFTTALCVDGVPKTISRAYAKLICQGLLTLCRRHRISPQLMEAVLQRF